MKKQLDSLQLYRGIASILVVLHHAHIILKREFQQENWFGIFHFGWIGVDFFFVLSGFLIFYIHQVDLGRASQFKTFVTKRFLRIYPFYWLMLAAKILGSLLLDRGKIFEGVSFLQLLQIVTLVPQEGINLTAFIGVAWTLTNEIFFYALFAGAILFWGKLSRALLALWSIGIILNLLKLLPIKGVILLEFIFNPLNLEFVFGCLAAYLLSKFELKHSKVWVGAAVGMLVAAIIGTGYEEFDVNGISSVIAYGIPLTVLIMASVRFEQTNTLAIPQILIYLGNTSYAVYLTHGLLINTMSRIYLKIADKLGIDLSASTTLPIWHTIAISTIVGLSIVIGCQIHDRIELPLIKYFRNKQMPKPES
jgi:exopolysaccharide production protein ExoZ